MEKTSATGVEGHFCQETERVEYKGERKGWLQLFCFSLGLKVVFDGL